MKVKITKAVLLDGLKTVQSIAPAKGSFQILQNVKMDAKDGKLTLTCSDVDETIVCECPCEVIEEDSTTIPVKSLISAVSVAQEGPISLSVNGHEKATFVSGEFKFSIVGLPATDFPNLPDANGTSIDVPKKIVKDMIRKTQYATSKDDTRRTLSGCLFSFKGEKLTAVATDGRRLAVSEYAVGDSSKGEIDIIVPAKAINELSKNLDGDGICRITIAGSQVLFDVGKAKIYSKLIDDSYPNYRQVIPKELKYVLSVDRNEFMDMLMRVAVFANNQNGTQMKFHIEDGVCSTSSSSADLSDATDRVSVKYDGEPVDVMLNPNYVMDAIKAIDEDTIDIYINDGTSPIVIRKGGFEDFLYVLMPLRIG